METRSKVAAVAAALVPFHCIICFDEFNLTDRTPMVLPCGHTYVCLQCTKRLKRCMECREPLFITAAAVAAASKGTSVISGGRSTTPTPPSQYGGPRNNNGTVVGRHYGNSAPPQFTATPPPLPQPIPLPIPKNVVLISLMEAAERYEVEDTQVEIGVAEPDEDEEEDFNLDRIIRGMVTLSGPCGTYKVADDHDLAVLPNDPRKVAGEEKKMADDYEFGKEVIQEPLPLVRGQSVQVVDFDDGVAKLARGVGYIVATSRQLVKVGGPLDSVCRLEGLLDTIVNRGRDLQSTIEQNQQIEVSLRKQIHTKMHEPPEYPVITEPNLLCYSEDNEDQNDGSPPTTPTNQEVAAHTSHIQTPERMPSRESTQALTHPCSSATYHAGVRPLSGSESPSCPRSPNSIDNSDLQTAGIPAYRRTVSEDDLDTLAFGCGAAFLSSGTGLFGADTWMGQRADLLAPSTGDQISPSGRTRLQSMEDSFLMHAAPTLTSSFDGVDFRTGLSGHRALSNAKTGSSPTPRGRPTRMMMSQHSGIGRIRAPPRRNSPTSTPAFGPRFSPFPFGGDA